MLWDHHIIYHKEINVKIIRKSIRELDDYITYMSIYVYKGFPEHSSLTFVTSFELLFENLDFLKEKIGADKYDILWDMGEQAKRHFEDKEIKLGVNLMQDMSEILRDQSPFAYPANLWRWD